MIRQERISTSSSCCGDEVSGFLFPGAGDGKPESLQRQSGGLSAAHDRAPVETKNLIGGKREEFPWNQSHRGSFEPGFEGFPGIAANSY